MSRETINNKGFQLNTRGEEKPRTSQTIGVITDTLHTAQYINRDNTRAYSGERATETLLIDKVREQVVQIKEKLVGLPGYNLTVARQAECVQLLNNIQSIINNIGLSTAVNYAIFEIVQIEYSKMYKWKLKAQPIVKDGIRRETDPIKVELLECPDANENPVRTATISVNFPITYVLAEVDWRYV